MKYWMAILLGALTAIPEMQLRAASFTETDRVVIFEAEDFSTNISPRSAREWVVTNAIAGFSGGGYVEALPDDGVNFSADWLTTSPELQYQVNLTNGGTYYVWIRGYATTNVSDSVHAGLNSTTNSASAITLVSGQFGTWSWTTNRTGLPRPTVSAAAGTHTFQLWMREDGMRVDRVALTTVANLQPIPGNAWHIPNNPEATVGLPSMRIPVNNIFANTPVTLVNGNQYQGAGGNPGTQDAAASAILYKRSTDINWTSLPVFLLATGGNNRYYSNTIPAGTFAAGDVIQYYFRIGYTDRLTTYVYGNDLLSLTSEHESTAQADPFSFTVQSPLEPSGAYLAVSSITPQGVVEARVYEESGHLSLVGPDLSGNPLSAAVTFAPPRVRVGGELHHVGRVLASTVISNGLELQQQLSTTNVVARLTFLAEGVMRYEVVDWGSLPVEETYLQSASDSAEHFYGFGEKFNAFDQAGKLVRMMNVDVFGNKGDHSYKTTPWFVSTRGYGFHLDSTAESWFDMRKTAADRYTISNRFPSLKFNVVHGPGLTNVLSRFTGYVGRPPSPPAWAFAPWMSSDIWHNGGEVRYLITKYRQLGIPGSVLVFDSPWEVGYNDFTWNMTQFGNSGLYEGTNWAGFSSLNEMMTFLRTNGFKVVCWMTPFINTSSVNDGVGGQNLGQASNYAAGAAGNYFVRSSPGGPPLLVNWWKGTGSPVDFTNPDARQWITVQLNNLVAESGDVIGGFKTDDGESGSADGNTYIPTNAVYFDGRTGVEMRNGYATEYHKTIWNVLGTNGIIFARSGFTGSQAYPAVWAGDNEPNFGENNGLASVVVAGQSAAMSGYSMWSHDVGGYSESNFSSTPANMFMRWAQFGALTPIMQMHRQTASNRQYPWSFGDEALSNYVFYARLHTSLSPYLRTYAHESAATGLPIIRPLVLMDQTDANTFGLRHTYLLGNELLYAAIITNIATTRTVYLPAGHWYDFFTHQKHIGGQNINWTNANQLECPLFVREGALLPMLPTNVLSLCDADYVDNSDLATWDGSLEFLAYPSSNSSFTLYDGTSLQCETNGTVTAFQLSSPARSVGLRVFSAEPFGVEHNGVSLSQLTNVSQSGPGWRYEVPFVIVKLNHDGGAAHIGFGPDSNGDGVSDSWRQFHFGSTATNGASCASCDPDGDGLSNLDEYHAGTNPTDPASALQVLHLDAATSLITWSSAPGRRYQVFATTNLSIPFEPVSGIINSAGNHTSYTDLAPTAAEKYYRVRLAP